MWPVQERTARPWRLHNQRQPGWRRRDPDRHRLSPIESHAKLLSRQQIDDLPIFFDPVAQVLSTLGIMGIPTTLLLDRDHRLLMTVVGNLGWPDVQVTAGIRRLSGLASRK